MLFLAEPILAVMGQDAALAERAGVFCRLLAPGVPPFFAFLGLTKYLQCQGILAPSVRPVLGSRVGVRRLFHLSLSLTASRVVLPKILVLYVRRNRSGSRSRRTG